MLRILSLSVRRLQAVKGIKRTLRTFEQWKHEVSQLKPSPQKSKKLLVIRLDDIGDYLLFRNSFAAYKTSRKWAGYEITLLGFTLWQELFEHTDNSLADKSIWLNKHEYFGNETYRKELWQRLRNEGFEVVVCPSRVRPLLLDDMCMLAAGADTNIASCNDFMYPDWNRASDKLYQQLYAQNTLCHEFLFNQAFASWACGVSLSLERPAFPGPTSNQPYFICFIGASFQSRRWTTERWIEFINLCKKDIPLEAVLAGGKNDIEIAAAIENATGVRNETGKVNLVAMTRLMANASAAVSNDTMASHLAASFNKPTVIITSGDNFYKFSAYKEAGITGVTTIYPEVFLKKWAQKKHQFFKGYVAVTNDIATIQASTVHEALKNSLAEPK